jgi:hypothetical protein
MMSYIDNFMAHFVILPVASMLFNISPCVDEV